MARRLELAAPAVADALAEPAPHLASLPAGETGRHDLALAFVLAVRRAVGAALDVLRRLVDRQLLVAGDRDQCPEEAGGRVDRVEQLLSGAPALGWPLLEDADRVAVAVGQVLQVGLLERGRVGDRDRAHRQAVPA